MYLVGLHVCYSIWRVCAARKFPKSAFAVHIEAGKSPQTLALNKTKRRHIILGTCNCEVWHAVYILKMERQWWIFLKSTSLNLGANISLDSRCLSTKLCIIKFSLLGCHTVPYGRHFPQFERILSVKQPKASGFLDCFCTEDEGTTNLWNALI